MLWIALLGEYEELDELRDELLRVSRKRLEALTARAGAILVEYDGLMASKPQFSDKSFERVKESIAQLDEALESYAALQRYMGPQLADAAQLRAELAERVDARLIAGLNTDIASAIDDMLHRQYTETGLAMHMRRVSGALDSMPNAAAREKGALDALQLLQDWLDTARREYANRTAADLKREAQAARFIAERIAPRQDDLISGIDALRAELEQRIADEIAAKNNAHALKLIEIALLPSSNTGALQNAKNWLDRVADAEQRERYAKQLYERETALRRQELAQLRQRCERARTDFDVNSAMKELQALYAAIEQLSPQRGELINEADALRGALLRRADDIQHAAERRAARLRIAKKAALALAAVACVGAIAWHMLLAQPARLDSARQLAARGDREAAATEYSALLDVWFLPNPGAQSAARYELTELRRAWAAQAEADGDYAAAILNYDQLGEAEKTTALRLQYGELLAAEGDYAGAIAQYAALPEAALTESQPRLTELYTEYAAQLCGQGDYLAAKTAYDRADSEALAARGITLESFLIGLARQQADSGDIDAAITTLAGSAVHDSPAITAELGRLRGALALQRGQAAIDAWLSAGADRSKTESLFAYGASLRDVGQVLSYWNQLLAAGVLPGDLFPDGLEVRFDDWPAIAAGLGEGPEPDFARPLAFTRTAREYEVSLFSVGNDTVSSSFTVKLLPEPWQRLPQERRALSKDECTCALLCDLTYERDGSAFGEYKMENVIKKMSGNSRFSTPDVLVSAASFPLFNAHARLVYCDLAAGGCRLIAENVWKHSISQMSLSRSVSVDFTRNDSYSSTSLGLSGAFDMKWVNDALADAIADIR